MRPDKSIMLGKCPAKVVYAVAYPRNYQKEHRALGKAAPPILIVSTHCFVSPRGRGNPSVQKIVIPRRTVGLTPHVFRTPMPLEACVYQHPVAVAVVVPAARRVDRWLLKTTVNNVTRLSNVSRAYVLVVRRVPCTVAHRAAWEATSARTEKNVTSCRVVRMERVFPIKEVPERNLQVAPVQAQLSAFRAYVLALQMVATIAGKVASRL